MPMPGTAQLCALSAASNPQKCVLCLLLITHTKDGPCQPKMLCLITWQAQELFLRSSIPRAALEMRMDLKHWADALKLAEQHAPDHIAAICKEHAASLEMTGTGELLDRGVIQRCYIEVLHSTVRKKLE